MRLRLGLVATLLFAQEVYAGAGSSGGAKGVFCTNERTHTVELVDIYIAKQHSQIRPALGSLEQEYLDFTKTLRYIVGDTRPVGTEEIDYLHSIMGQYFNFLPTGATLAELDDAGTLPELPQNCGYVQIAVYDDETNIVSVNSDLYNQMGSLNQGALVAHETIYRMYRQLGGDKTSENTRKLVGVLFGQTLPPRQAEGVPENSVQCFGKNSRFYVYQDPENPDHTVFQFAEMLGLSTFSPLKIRIPTPIDWEKDLELSFVGDQMVQKVVNPNANINQLFNLDTGIFTSLKLGVQYQFGKPLKLNLVNNEQVFLQSDFVESCTVLELDSK